VHTSADFFARGAVLCRRKSNRIGGFPWLSARRLWCFRGPMGTSSGFRCRPLVGFLAAKSGEICRQSPRLCGASARLRRAERLHAATDQQADCISSIHSNKADFNRLTRIMLHPCRIAGMFAASESPRKLPQYAMSEKPAFQASLFPDTSEPSPLLRSRVTNDPVSGRTNRSTSEGRRIADLYREFMRLVDNPESGLVQTNAMRAAELNAAVENELSRLRAGTGSIQEVSFAENLARRAVAKLNIRQGASKPKPKLADYLRQKADGASAA
jgi:hypothetical protein